MNDLRRGDALWIEWEGEEFPSEDGDPIIFYTLGFVSLDDEVVREGLASRIQRDGIVDSLSEARKLIDAALVSAGFALEEDGFYTFTALAVETDEDFYAEDLTAMTWVEIFVE